MEAVKHAHNAHNTCARARVRVSARTHKPVSRTHARTHSRPPAIKSSLHGRFVYVRLHTQAHTDFGLSVCSRVLHVCALWPLEYSHEQRLQPGRAASAVGASTCISMRAAAFPRTAAKATQGPQARVALAHCAQAQALRFRVFWPHRNVKRVADQARQDIQELWEVQHAVGMACLVVDKGLELLQRKIRVERAGGPEVGTPRAHVSSACGGCAHHTKTRRAVQRATALVPHIT